MNESYPEVQNFWHDLQQQFSIASNISYDITLSTQITPENFIPEKLQEIEFCELKLHGNNSFCVWCEPLCEIHTIKPCENNWGSFAKICCGLCDFQCDVECSGPVTTTTTTPVTTPETTPVTTPVTTNETTPETTPVNTLVLLYILISLFSVIGRVL